MIGLMLFFDIVGRDGDHENFGEVNMKKIEFHEAEVRYIDEAIDKV